MYYTEVEKRQIREPALPKLLLSLPRASPRGFDGGGGGADSDTQNHLPPNFSFPSNFGYFAPKMLENVES